MARADNPENIVGYNSANNRADSSLVTPNEDGSIVERQEYMQERQENMQEKIGNEGHLWGNEAKSVLSYANAAYQHIHMPGYIWPNDCTVVTPTSDATANTFGDFVELVGAGDIVAPYDCHWVTVTDISDNGVFIVEFHVVSDGDLQTSEEYLTAFSVSRLSPFTRSTQVSVQMPAISGGKRVGARVKQSAAGTESVSFNIHYHEYE